MSRSTSPASPAHGGAAAVNGLGMVSFVIPNYNHARYLGDAIRSALAQTYPHIELIVVDDGSTDDSRSVVEYWIAEHGERIRYIYQTNAGLSAARNTGVQAACGEYIALLDADDLVEQTYAERLLAALAQSPDADGVYCGFRFVDQDNQDLLRTERRTFAAEALYPALLMGNFWVPESVLVRRSCYTAMGEFDPALRACEDWDVWLRFARHYRLVGIDDVLIRYRVAAGSMSSNPLRMLDNRLAVLRKHLGDPPPASGATLTHQAYGATYLRSAVEYYQAGDEEGGYRCLLNGARLFPPLLLHHTTYYELACSGQTRGSEGRPSAAEVAASEKLLRDLVRRLANDPALGPGVIAGESALRARMLWAMGLLYYQAGASGAARDALWAAGRLEAGLWRRRSFVGLLARTVVGRRQVALLKDSVRRNHVRR